MAGTPIHVQLRRALLLECASGDFLKGQRFFSNRRICRIWKVSDSTAKSSLAWLESKKVIAARPRSGYYLLPNFQQKAQLLLHQQQGDEVLPSADRPATRRFGLVGGVRGQTGRVSLIVSGKRSDANRMPSLLESPGPGMEWSRTFFEEAVNRAYEFQCYLYGGLSDQTDTIVGRVLEERPDGVALFIRNTRISLQPFVQVLLKANIPVVRVFGGSEQSHIPTLNINNIAIGYEAVRRMCRQGHRRLAVLVEPRAYPYFLERVDGCRLALSERGGDSASLEVLPVSLTRAPGKTLQDRFKDPETRPTALFATRIELVRRMLPVFRQAGISVPGDLSVIACGAATQLPGMPLAVDSFLIDFGNIGRRAFRMLHELMQGTLKEPHPLVEPVYRREGTLRPYRH